MQQNIKFSHDLFGNDLKEDLQDRVINYCHGEDNRISFFFYDAT